MPHTLDGATAWPVLWPPPLTAKGVVNCAIQHSKRAGCTESISTEPGLILDCPSLAAPGAGLHRRAAGL